MKHHSFIRRHSRALMAMALLALASALCSDLSHAQGTGKIAGRIRDKQTGEPLIGVNVLVKGTMLGAATDEDDPVTGEDYTRDPRNIARKAANYLKGTGIADTAYYGPELEFFIFHDIRFDQNEHEGYYHIDSVEGRWNTGRMENPNLGYRPRYKEGYFPVPPTDSQQDIRSEMVLALEKIGIRIEAQHHEVATAGQAEIDMRFAPLVEMADNVLKYKYILKNTARKHGRTVTFMPKPLFATRFAGSLFGLETGTACEARVPLSDPNGVTGAPSTVVPPQTRADVLPEPSLRTLYVSPAGSDTNAGTCPGAPLRTIQRAADLAQAGDLVLVQPGVYRESVSVPRSGTASQPIVFRGNGPGAILDGADAAIAAGVAWTSSGSGVYSVTTGFATGPDAPEAARLYRYGSTAELQAPLPAGPPGGFHFDGTRLHVKLSHKRSFLGLFVPSLKIKDLIVPESCPRSDVAAVARRRALCVRPDGAAVL